MKICVLFFSAALLLLLCSPITSAQTTIPNSGFESWTAGSPDNWLTDNVTSISVTPITKSSTAHSGSSSARGDVVSLSATAPSPLAPLLQSGIAGSGFPYTQRPASLTGYYQFTPVSGSGDQVIITVLMTKGSLVRGTAIASGSGKISAAASSWQQFSIPLLYIGQQAPDTCYVQIAIGAATGSSKPTIGSYFLVDDLAFSGSASAVNEAARRPPIVYFGPELSQSSQPVYQDQFFYRAARHVALKVYSLLGTEVANLVNEQKGTGSFSVNWNAAGLPSGMYLYRMSVTSEKGQIFEAAKKLVLLK